ncbi:DUF6678 family protein [Pontibacter sp. HSC-36F09]|uniref:DUF6678 family protein n=1 Tax=Pontibacter sp. HSC-36F09 TaxID=2910966 RepID=UPI0020A08D63|nr:DUF6678 family protein [Pontibacter sp. HSC-36F09]MCP2044551.1 hypothetical protein [Pontibacter sp. HSC-36F09]
MAEPVDVLSRLLEEKRLVPILNQTKWREQIGAMCELSLIDLNVRMKYLQDDKEPVGYAPIWWNQLEQTGLNNIEWLEIKALKEIGAGLLAPTLQEDYTDLVQKVLDRYSIPYIVEGEVFRITGYQQLQ